MRAQISAVLNPHLNNVGMRISSASVLVDGRLTIEYPATPTSESTGGGSSLNYPFGSRIDAYGLGILPTNYSTASMDTIVKLQYDSWKTNRLFTAGAAGGVISSDTRSIFSGSSVSGCYYVQFNSSASFSYVSEGMGYGMLIMVMMAGYEANAQNYFDGLYKMARCRPAYQFFIDSGSTDTHYKYLMEWKIKADWSTNNDGYNAADGDMDLALALIMADRQWGSAGAINYSAEAVNTINAIKNWNCAFSTTANAAYAVPLVNTAGFRFASRTSDYMYDHFRQYKAITGDTFWDTALANCQSLITGIINLESPNHKLTPGWIVDTTTSPVKSPGGIIESPNEGEYDFNAIRNPWRWAVHYIMAGNATSRSQAGGITSKIFSDIGGNAEAMPNFYTMSGSASGGPSRNMAMLHGIMAGAVCNVNASDQAWLNSAFTTCANNVQTGYFDTELILMSEIFVTGNWWSGV